MVQGLSVKDGDLSAVLTPEKNITKVQHDICNPGTETNREATDKKR